MTKWILRTLSVILDESDDRSAQNPEAVSCLRSLMGETRLMG